MPARPMTNLEDPADVIYKNVGMKNGKIPGFELMANRVLLGLYVRPEKTKGGLYLSDTTRAEEKYQGKAAVVLMIGPTAFVSDSHFNFLGQKVEVGDWVSIWTTDGKAISINNADCRVIRDQDIAMKIPAPDQVY
jgi:co-chaperonin GroES (HSP10)